MKKIIAVFAVWLISTPLFASLSNEVERAVVAAASATVSWQEKLAALKRSFARIPAGDRFRQDTPSISRNSLSYTEEHRYLLRLVELQRHINVHPALRGFTFVAPLPEDLARLSAGYYEALLNFVKANSLSTVTAADYPRPFTLALHLAQENNRVEVWVDVPTKRIYLMSDNFYTSAANKYSLHLR